MKPTLTALAVGAVLFGSVALAADASDPLVIGQKALMTSIGGTMKTLGEMASGAAYDIAAAEAAKAALMAAAADIPVKFAKAGNDPASEASPAIWTNWDDYMAKGKAMADAAAALDVASAASIGAGMGAIGGTCKDCHMSYRVKK